MTRTPVEVVAATHLRPTPVAKALSYQRLPYSAATAFEHASDVPIRSPDAAEGASRGLPQVELVRARQMVVGAGAGETWHTHLSYYDIYFYIVSGSGTVSWRDAEGHETVADIARGDFVRIDPNATHQWLNTGSEDLTVISFEHFHNYS